MKTSRTSYLFICYAIALFFLPLTALAKQDTDPELSKMTQHYVEILRSKIKNYTAPNVYDFSPGEYEILWDKAVLASSKNLLCLNIPLATQNKYIASHIDVTKEETEEETSKKKKEETVLVTHKLIVSWVSNPRNQIGGETEQIITLIPSQKHYKKYGDSYGDIFNHPSGIGKYNGTAILTDPASGKIISVATYTKGSLTKLRRLTGNPSQETINQVQSTISGIDFQLIK